MEKKLNGYLAYYNQGQKEVYAESSYAAYLKAVEMFSPPKSKRHMVHVVLCELNGEQVYHRPVD